MFYESNRFDLRGAMSPAISPFVTMNAGRGWQISKPEKCARVLN